MGLYERIINMNELQSIQYYILNQLKADFEANNVPVVLRSSGEENIPMDILTTLHRRFGRDLDEVMGEYYFFPSNGGQAAVHYFTSMISLTEDMAAEYAPVVTKAMDILNFYLECGAFVMNPREKLLAFKFITPIPADLPAERILQIANINVAHSLQLAERYADHLLRLSDGRESLESFMELMPKV